MAPEPERLLTCGRRDWPIRRVAQSSIAAAHTVGLPAGEGRILGRQRSDEARRAARRGRAQLCLPRFGRLVIHLGPDSAPERRRGSQWLGGLIR
jgi:hypothetical protein